LTFVSFSSVLEHALSIYHDRQTSYPDTLGLLSDMETRQPEETLCLHRLA